MHPQIKDICSTLTTRSGKVQFELTSCEGSSMGDILAFMYYRTGIVDLVREYVIGYPHNGGRHSCSFNGPWGDAVAFIELLKETYLARNVMMDEEHCRVANELSFLSQDIIAKKY